MLGKLVSGSLGKVLTTMLVIGIAGSTVSYGTFATFTAQTTNPGNTFASGTMTMTNVAGSVVTGSDCGSGTYGGTCATLFNLANLKPGATASNNTVTITYTGSIPTTSFGVHAATHVAKDAASGAGCQATTPSDKINLVLKQGASIIFSGTVAGFATAHPVSTPLSLSGGTNGNGSAGVWSNTNSSVFTIEIGLDGSAGNTYQGCVSKIDLVWIAA
jgi:hypothetical protein